MANPLSPETLRRARLFRSPVIQTLRTSIHTPRHACLLYTLSCNIILDSWLACVEKYCGGMGDACLLAIWVCYPYCPHRSCLTTTSSRDGASPYAITTLHPVSPSQPYDISLHLVVPTSQSNLELGNFMAALNLTTLSHTAIASARRSVGSPL